MKEKLLAFRVVGQPSLCHNVGVLVDDSDGTMTFEKVITYNMDIFDENGMLATDGASIYSNLPFPGTSEAPRTVYMKGSIESYTEPCPEFVGRWNAYWNKSSQSEKPSAGNVYTFPSSKH